MATLLTLVESNYVDRLIAQFRTQPKARATIAICVKQAIGDDLANQLLAAFNVDTAVGVQLDTIGKYVGVNRNIGANPAGTYFGLWRYASDRDPALYQGTWDPASDTPAIPAAAGGNAGWWYVASADGTSASPIVASFKSGDVIFSDGAVWAKETDDNGNGLTSYSDPAVNMNGVFYSYAIAGRTGSALTDASYRVVIKLKAILNANDGTLASIMAYLNAFFPATVFLTDNKDMTLAYLVVSTIPLSPALLAIYLPKPMGVGITVTIISPTPSGGETLTTEDGLNLTTEDGTVITTETTL